MSELKAIEQERAKITPRLNQLVEDSGRRKLTHAERDEWAKLHLRHQQLVRRLRALRRGERVHRGEPAPAPEEPGSGQ